MAAAARVRASALAVPAWAWLAGLVALSAVVRYGFARRVVAPWIFVDELIYSELAKSFAESASFAIRGEPFGGAYGVVYPLLLSPAWALFESVPDAYAAAKAINAVVVSLAAVPAYLLARRVVSQVGALVAAGLTLAMPSMLYAGTLMTENAFLPVFLVAALALVLVLERPTAARIVALLVAVGLAFATRAQAVVFLPALLTAPLLMGRRRLREFAPLYGVLAVGAVLVLAVQWARGRSPLDLLGAYRAAEEGSYDAGAAARWLLWHVAELDLAVAIVPFAAFVLLAARLPRLDPRDRAFMAASTALVAWLLLQVAVFASRHALRVEERNMLYLVPLFLVALVLFVERGLPRPPLPAALAAVAAAALPAFLPYDDLIDVSAVSDTFGLLPWWEVHSWGVPLDLVWLPAFGAGLLGAAAFLAVPARAALVLPALVLVAFSVSVPAVESRIRGAAIGALFQGVTDPDRDWVDRAVGTDADVAVIRTPGRDWMTVLQNEFFSRSVRGVYHLDAEMPTGLAQTALRVDRSSGLLVGPDAQPVRPEYALVDESVPVAGEVVARDRTKGMLLYELDGPLGLDRLVSGLDADGWTRGTLVVRRYGCDAPATLVLEVARDPGLFLGRQRVGPATLAAGVERATVRVPMERTAQGYCLAVVPVSPTTVPGGGDDRALGVRVESLSFR